MLNEEVLSFLVRLFPNQFKYGGWFKMVLQSIIRGKSTVVWMKYYKIELLQLNTKASGLF